MEHGFLILALVALLFISIYGYSYIPFILERRKIARLKIEQTALDKVKDEEKLMKQELRDERLKKSLKRSAEIRMELERLEQMKTNRKGFFEDELLAKVEKMKKQQAS
jgi:hypothetical protein